MYFVYDPNGDGFQLCDSEIEAKEAAEIALFEERQEAMDSEWSYEVGDICWGKVFEIATEQETIEDKESDYNFTDYELEKI